MNSNFLEIDYFLKLWINLLISLISINYLLNIFGLLKFGNNISLILLIIFVINVLRNLNIFNIFYFFRTNKLFSILFLLCIFSSLFASHSFLDSYVYRIPQILLWVQEGLINSIPNVDMRINQMPYVWPFISSIFLDIFGEKGLSIPNLLGFLFSYVILLKILKRLDLDSNIIIYSVIIFLSSPVIILLSSSNDNIICSISLLLISFYFLFCIPLSNKSIMYSLAALTIACGIKPQYVTLGLVWLIWFFKFSGYTIYSFKKKTILIYFLILFICSPFPTFIYNQINNDSFINPQVKDSFVSQTFDKKDEDKAVKIFKSVIYLNNHLFALPINPLADEITNFVTENYKKSNVFKNFPLDNFRVWKIVIPENASFGFFASVTFFIGLFISFCKYSKYRPLIISILVSLFLSLIISTPNAAGRSFIGFFIVLIPFSILGLNYIKINLIKKLSIFCFAIGLIMIFINPAAPLLPLNTLKNNISNENLKLNIENFESFSKRHLSGRELISLVPENQNKIGAIIDPMYPITELWKPYNLERKVYFYNIKSTLNQMIDNEINYVIIRNDSFDSSKALRIKFLQSINGSIINTMEFISFLSKGYEKWHLVKINL